MLTYTGPRDLSTQPVSDPFFGSYTTLIDELFQANGQAALAIDDPTLRRGVELTDLASHQIENVARLTRVLLLAGVSGGLHEPTDVAEAAGLLGQVETGVDQVRELGTGRYQPAAAKVDQEFSASGFTDLARSAIETGDVLITETMASLSREDDEGYNGFRTSVNTEISDRADELNDEAAATRIRYLALGGLALLVAGLVTWLVSRSITRPLRSLTQQAKSMAEDRLPAAVTDILETPLGEDVTVPTVEPVRVNTRDEVSDVADALNTVQDSALDLAVEQAVLRRNIADSFVNLGRRNQNLLGRQLDFITELETNETNADTLSNLFRLDHLATRMRRNAESLLVLAGIEPPRQWAAPVRLTDVIRAALGEVEDYQRVTVRGVEPATIIGSAAADLAHLLAELIENALVFSPPDQTVDIRGRNRPGHGGDGSRRATRSPSSTRASACRPGTSWPPTAASRGPRASRSRRRSTWATTWPATSPPATTSGSPRQLARATASPRPSTCRRRCSRATASWPPSRPRRDASRWASPRSFAGARAAASVRRAGPAAPVDVPPAPAFDAAQLDGLAPVRSARRGARAPGRRRGVAADPHRQRPGQAVATRVRAAPAAAMPDGDLLASLSSITEQHAAAGHRRSRRPRSDPGRPPGVPPTNPWTPPAHARPPGHEPLVARAARPRAACGDARRQRPPAAAEPRRQRR